MCPSSSAVSTFDDHDHEHQAKINKEVEKIKISSRGALWDCPKEASVPKGGAYNPNLVV